MNYFDADAALPPVRVEPLLAAYDRFKHLDAVLEMVQDSDDTEQTNPFHMTARDLWRAIKASLGHTANAPLERSERSGDTLGGVVGNSGGGQ